MSPIISPLVTRTRVNCRSNSGMDGFPHWRRGGDGRGRLAAVRYVGDVGDLQAHLYLAGTAVLVSDLGGQFDVLRLRVERRNGRGVFLRHEAPADLARAGDLIVVGVELFVHQQEAADAPARLQSRIAGADFLGDER